MATSTTEDKRIDLDIAVAQSDLGAIGVAVRRGRLAAVAFGYQQIAAAGRVVEQRAATLQEARRQRRPGNAAAEAVLDELLDYAAGSPVEFTGWLLDDEHLTPFQARVIDACRSIPRGQTRTYGQLADAAGSPRAARAVGTVMSSNRWPLIIPCHRVLGAGGKLGGYSARQGLAMKRKLLALETRE